MCVSLLQTIHLPALVHEKYMSLGSLGQHGKHSHFIVLIFIVDGIVLCFESRKKEVLVLQCREAPRVLVLVEVAPK